MSKPVPFRASFRIRPVFALLAGLAIAAPGFAEDAAKAPAAASTPAPAAALPAAAATPPAGTEATTAPATHHAHATSDTLFAEVNGQIISAGEYESTFMTMARQKFYHGKPPEAQIQALRLEVADRLINRVLLLNEVKRREIKPDEKAIEIALAEYDKRYGNSPGWQQNRATLLPGLSEKLREQQLLERIESDARAIPAPSPAEVRAYYDAHNDLFTEPEKLHLSVILLKVDPSSPASAWDKAEEEAAAIRRRIEAGADFGALARLHSGDASAEKDGDMGYIHRGMLPEAMHEKVDKMKSGDLSTPIRVLEGYALLRLHDRREPKLRAFEEVSGRAKDLLQRERSESAWKEFVAKLRASASIRIDTERFPFLKAAPANGT